MRKPSLVIAVVEDDHHKMLVYRYLIKCGIREHEIRIERSPSGRGSAENWVRHQFVKETKVYRARHAQTALVVMIDADAGTVQNRCVQLDQALLEKGRGPVGDMERIARLVPKRQGNKSIDQNRHIFIGRLGVDLIHSIVEVSIEGRPPLISVGILRNGPQYSDFQSFGGNLHTFSCPKARLLHKLSYFCFCSLL